MDHLKGIHSRIYSKTFFPPNGNENELNQRKNNHRDIFLYRFFRPPMSVSKSFCAIFNQHKIKHIRRGLESERE